jgi:hypothetical protein
MKEVSKIIRMKELVPDVAVAHESPEREIIPRRNINTYNIQQAQ